MTVTSNNANIPMQSLVSTVPYLVGASTRIYNVSAVCVNTTTGYAFPGADTANFKYVGLANAEANNTNGSAGDQAVPVIPPREGFQFIQFYATSPLQSWVGNKAYLISSDTVGITSSNSVLVGRIVAIITSGTSGMVLVDTMDRSA